MEEDRSSRHHRTVCKRCLYFREEEYTGYCRLHHMYAPKTFDCPEFVPRHISAEDGGANETKEEKRRFNEGKIRREKRLEALQEKKLREQNSNI